MKRVWHTSVVSTGELAQSLNGIEARGGVIFAILDDGARRSFVTAVWFHVIEIDEPKQPPTQPMKPPKPAPATKPAKKRSTKPA